jgi:serine/threonine protein kinase
MQYLSNGDFASRAQRGFSEQELSETLGAVARALGYVHQRGLIHRAITPQNVIYDSHDAPVLVDFGIPPTPNQDSAVTSLGFPVEISRYMSPEQARGGEQNARSDIYSLGALAFYGLTGRPPYDGADGFAVAYAHVFEPIPRLAPERSHWQPLIDGALAKDPKDRFANVEAFLGVLSTVALARDAPQRCAARCSTAMRLRPQNRQWSRPGHPSRNRSRPLPRRFPRSRRASRKNRNRCRLARRSRRHDRSGCACGLSQSWRSASC